MQKLLFLSLIIAASIIVAAVSAVPVLATGGTCNAPDLSIKCNGVPLPPFPTFPMQFSCNGPVIIDCCGNGTP